MSLPERAEKHIPALDGIRGIAILLVLISHGVGGGPFTLFKVEGFLRWVFLVTASGWWGVDLFFVLSGFLITGILLATKTARNRAYSFYVRRFLRIFPIYYLVLIVVLIVSTQSVWMRQFVEPYWYTWASLFLYLQNWTPVFAHGHQIAGILGHLWSLAVEEQFYLVWPMLVWLLPARTVLKLCVIGVVAALALRIALVSIYGPHLWIHQLTVTRGEGLLVGSALAVLASLAHARGRKIAPKLIVAMGAAGMAIVGFIAVVHPREFVDTNSGPLVYTIGVTGFALLCGALVASSQYRVRWLTPFVEMPWLRVFGKYSYGIYVYHVPVVIVFRFALIPALGLAFPLTLPYSALYLASFVAVTFGIAWISYTFFEERFLRLKRNFRATYATVDAAVPADAAAVTLES